MQSSQAATSKTVATGFSIVQAAECKLYPAWNPGNQIHVYTTGSEIRLNWQVVDDTTRTSNRRRTGLRIFDGDTAW